MSLSAVVLAYDEELMLRRCLELLDFVDELVVVIDARTPGRTEGIAREFTDEVHIRELDNFREQRNFSLDRASGDWILQVDPDERVTPALAREIQETVASPRGFAGFQIGCVHYFRGKHLRHVFAEEGDSVRLFRREGARYEGWRVHETAEAPGPVGRLGEELWHFQYRRITELLIKTETYGKPAAQDMLARGFPPVTSRKLFRVLAKELYLRMGKNRAYRDGIEGVIEVLYLAFNRFCEEVMLWELQREPSLEQVYEQLDADAGAQR